MAARMSVAGEDLNMVTVKESPSGHEELRQLALDHLWMNSRSWTEMAEQGSRISWSRGTASGSVMLAGSGGWT